MYYPTGNFARVFQSNHVLTKDKYPHRPRKIEKDNTSRKVLLRSEAITGHCEEQAKSVIPIHTIA